jgi:hypothetical protein
MKFGPNGRLHHPCYPGNRTATITPAFRACRRAVLASLAVRPPFLLVLRLVRLAAVDRCEGSRPIPDGRPYRIVAPPDQVLTVRQVFEREEAIPIADGFPVDGARQGEPCGCSGAELIGSETQDRTLHIPKAREVDDRPLIRSHLGGLPRGVAGQSWRRFDDHAIVPGRHLSPLPSPAGNGRPISPRPTPTLHLHPHDRASLAIDRHRAAIAPIGPSPGAGVTVAFPLALLALS